MQVREQARKKLRKSMGATRRRASAPAAAAATVSE